MIHGENMINFKTILNTTESNIKYPKLPKDFTHKKMKSNNILLGKYEEGVLYSSAKNIIYFSEVEKAEEVAYANMTDNSTNVIMFNFNLASDDISYNCDSSNTLENISLILPYRTNVESINSTEFEIIENAKFISEYLLKNADICVKELFVTLLVALYYIDLENNNKLDRYSCSLKFIHSLIAKSDLRWIVQLQNALYENHYDKNYAFVKLDNLLQLSSNARMNLIHKLKITLEKCLSINFANDDQNHIFLYLNNQTNVNIKICSSYNQLCMKIFTEYFCKNMNDITPTLFIIHNPHQLYIFNDPIFIKSLLSKNIQILSMITDHAFIHDYWSWTNHSLLKEVDYYILDDNYNAEVSLNRLIHPQFIERKQKKMKLPNRKSIFSPMPSSRLILHPDGNGWAI